MRGGRALSPRGFSPEATGESPRTGASTCAPPACARKVGLFPTECRTPPRATRPMRAVRTLASGGMTELERLVRRLRGFTARTWRGDGRLDAVRRLADGLVEVGGSGHLLPDI